MTMYDTPSIGTPVMTADGQELGKVKEVTGGCFKIDAPMAPDYWLGSDLARERVGGVIKLSISKEMLSDVKMDAPDHMGVHRHNS